VLNEKKKKLADQGEMFRVALKEAEQRVADAAAGSAGGGGGGRSTPPVESDDSESDGDDSWVQPTQARPAALPPAAPAAEPRRGVKKEEASGSGATHAARAVPMATASQQKRAPAVRGHHALSMRLCWRLLLLFCVRACELMRCACCATAEPQQSVAAVCAGHHFALREHGAGRRRGRVSGASAAARTARTHEHDDDCTVCNTTASNAGWTLRTCDTGCSVTGDATVTHHISHCASVAKR
jgi:hypothetical protein